MWQRFRASSSWRAFADDQRGISAILLVLGITVLLLIAGATVAGQAKYELQMSAAQAEAEQTQLLILGAFNDAMKRAENTSWPTTAYDGSSNPCTLSGSEFPRYCIDALARPTGNGQQSIPIRITYQMASGKAPAYEYGWVLFVRNATTGAQTVQGFRIYRTWCTYQTNSTMRSRFGPCVQGG